MTLSIKVHSIKPSSVIYKGDILITKTTTLILTLRKMTNNMITPSIRTLSIKDTEHK
jgi:hypothetical protein